MREETVRPRNEIIVVVVVIVAVVDIVAVAVAPIPPCFGGALLCIDT